MIRVPSDRRALWAAWEDRLAGRRVELTAAPQCGLYKARRDGRWVGVQIDIESDTDPETGELVGDERFVAWIQHERFDAEDVWPYAAKNPVTREEFKRLLTQPIVNDLSREVVT